MARQSKPKRSTKKTVTKTQPVAATPVVPKKSLVKKLLKFGIPLVVLILLVWGGLKLYRMFFIKDTEPPSLDITSVADDWTATNDSEYEITGLVDDKSGVSEIEYETSDGKKGKATIDKKNKTWTAKVSLKPGDNKIKIKAKDKTGKTSETEITVVYNQKVVFFGIPESNPGFVFIGEPAKLIVSIEAEALNEKESISKVSLYKGSPEGKTAIAEMFDNGNPVNGDDIPGDGRFSAVINVTEKEDLRLRVGAFVANQEDLSGQNTVKALKRPTAADIQSIKDFNETAQTQFDTFVKDFGETANQKFVEWLETRPEIAAAGITEGSSGAWWEFKDTGILGGTINNPEGTRGGNGPGLLSGFGQKFAVGETNAAAEPPEVGNTNALYLGPYRTEFGKTDDSKLGLPTIENNKCPKCKVVKKFDKEVTWEYFAGMDKYGIVLVSSHGDTWFGDPIFGTQKSNSRRAKVIAYTDQAVTDAAIPEMLAGRLAWGLGDKVVVLPEYIRHNNKKFPRSIIVMGICRGSYNTTMAAAFLARGASAYYSYTEYVDSGYAQRADNAVIEAFLKDGDNHSDSFTKAVGKVKTNDGGKPPAFLAMTTIGKSAETVMGGKKIVNGSFEEGGVGWTSDGDAKIIRSLGPLSPQDGKRMGIISTGLGSVSDSNSTLIQEFCARKKYKQLVFKYDFVSEEPREYIGSRFDDAFEVTITINGKKTLIKRESINSSSWKGVKGINFAGGDSTTFHTGWKSASFNIGNINPEDQIEVKFHVFDKGDSIYDSAAIIDAVALVE